ncbi:MAG: 16S rRNA (adenine1518-N6/adenine1519-N6)-dimethyltransferase [Bacteroidetes bacterium]|nr:MAG: 16S rRNA (adenine1518-N6/adenine1519-N6)-dimethyltransferase [Bacteroidota bacterium]
MSFVPPKKHLGQHFLRDENIAAKIAGSLVHHTKYKTVLEIGPGMGVLTKYLLQRPEFETRVVEIDRDSVTYLQEHYPELAPRIIAADFLKLDLAEKFKEPFAIIGNFPYNISSQILFKALEVRNLVPEIVGMFQKEVAERIAEPPGSKTYGITSVLLQAFYDIQYLFTVSEHVFHPPPKVKSAVIRLTRNQTQKLDCDEDLFVRVVKAGFNQRRKTLRNGLKQFKIKAGFEQHRFFSERAERLSVADFVELTNMLESV